MWLGSPSNSWQSCMVEMHGVNRCFVKVRINFPLTLGSGFHLLVFKKPRKLRANPLCSHNQLAKKISELLVSAQGQILSLKQKAGSIFLFSQV